MSKASRTEKIAKEMVAASENAALIIEACENLHHLKKEESLDVLAGCVVRYLMGDGVTREEEQAKRMVDFIDHLVDYSEAVLGINLYDDEDVFGN